MHDRNSFKKYLWLIFILIFLTACQLFYDITSGTVEDPIETKEEETEIVEPTEELIEEPIEAETEAPTQEELIEVSTIEPTLEVDEIEPTEALLPDLTGTEITIWHAFYQEEGIKTLIDEFNASNDFGITVYSQHMGSYNDLATIINAGIESGELPNLTVGYSNIISGWYEQGVIASLNEYIDNVYYGFSDEEKANFYSDPYSSGTLANGTQISLPIQQSAYVLFYNNTWAQELGFDHPPRNSAEFEEQACIATAANQNDDNPDNDNTGGYVYFPDASMVSSWIWAFGGEYVSPDGGAYDFNNEAVYNAAEFFWDLNNFGCILLTPSYPNPEFANREALFITSSSAGIPYQYSAMEGAGNEDVWTAIPYPGPDGEQYINSFGQMAGIINTNETEDLASWLFLRWLLSPESQSILLSYSNYLPTLKNVENYDLYQTDPVWANVYDMLELGKSEPILSAHGAVRAAIRDAFFEILDAGDMVEVEAILDELNQKAEDIVAESQ